MRSQSQALCIALTLLLISATAGAQNARIESFRDAKKHLAIIHDTHPVTLYSGCAYKEKAVEYDSCLYVPATPGVRADRIEWEHVVPAEAFGRAFIEWREGHPRCVNRQGKPFRGRHCAAKVSREYRRIEADLYNLHPEIGDLNARRSNYAMGQIPRGVAAVDTGCGKIGGGLFEPPPDVRGAIARTYLYMDAAYPRLRLVSDQKRKLFEAWSAGNPVDAWECERAARVARIQGNTNEFVRRHCPVIALHPPA